MKIIDIAICVNNIDPKGLGRIRYRSYGIFTSEQAGGVKYIDWDEMDPFIAIPFLPAHINIIPQIQQSIKLIKYDTDKDTQNVEYISGPFTSPHNLQDQTFTLQHKGTTFGGVIVKEIKDIRGPNGAFNGPTTRGTIVANKDVGFRGNYGSDLIFTENGVQLRGGMLLSKQGNKKDTILDYPQMAKKMGRISLKKFSKTLKTTTNTIEKSEVITSRIKYIIEYEINSLATPTELKLFAYKVMATEGTQFNTNVFNESSTFSATDITQVYLINTGMTYTDASYIKTLNGTIQSAYIELRDMLYLIDKENLSKLDFTYPIEDIHPFYFRPTPNFRLEKGGNETEASNKAIFTSNVQLRNITEGYGLIYSKNSVNPPTNVIIKAENVAKEIKGAGEQSFSNLSADKIYITSTDPNIGTNVKSINFNDLDEYELTQEDYINRIEPNTYAMVRGENLYNVLMAMKKLFDKHTHNVNKPLVQGDPSWIELDALMKTLRDDLLNDSIRIN